jgi:hypothetical protein
MQVFPAPLVDAMEVLCFIFGRTMPMNALPYRCKNVREKMNEPHEIAVNEFSWRGPYEHQAIHHIQGADLEGDSCYRTATLFNLLRLRPSAPFQYHHSFQGYFIYQYIVCTLMHAFHSFSFVLMKILFFIFGIQQGFVTDPRTWASFIGIFFEVLVSYGLYYRPLLSNTFVFVMFLFVVKALLPFVILFHGQHIWDYPAVPIDTENSDWGRYNAESTYSFKAEAWLPICWFNDGASTIAISNHLEHTLYPSMNYLYLPLVSDIIMETAAKHKVKVNEIKSYLALRRSFSDCLVLHSTERDSKKTM